MSRLAAQQMTTDYPKDYGRCVEPLQHLYQQRPMKQTSTGLTHKLSFDQQQHHRQTFFGGRKLEGKEPPRYEEKEQQAASPIGKPAAILEPIKQQTTTIKDWSNNSSYFNSYKSYNSDKLSASSPSQQSVINIRQQQATTTNKQTTTTTTAKPLQQSNYQNGICEQVAWQLLQDIKRGKLSKKHSRTEMNSIALSLLDQHFDRHLVSLTTTTAQSIHHELPTTSTSTLIKSTITRPSMATTSPRQQPMPATNRSMTTATPFYKTVCKYVRFDRHHKVEEDTYVIKLKSNRLVDLKQALPTYANPNYRFFVRNRHNQLEQIVNDDQLLCTIKDKNGQDVIFCEIVKPNSP